MQTILINKKTQDIYSPEISLNTLALMVTPIGLGQSALLVFLPLLVEHSPLGYGQWAQLFALGMVFYFVGSILWPLRLPRAGYGAVIGKGLLGYSASMLMLATCLWGWQQGWLNDNLCIAGLAASRVVYGLFSSALVPAGQSGCAQISSTQQRLKSFSTISLNLALARSGGPLLALLLSPLHWLAPIWVLMAWPLVLVGMFLGKRMPTSPPLSSSKKKLDWLAQLKAPMGFTLIAMASTAFASSLQFYAAPILETLLQTQAQQVSHWLGALMLGAAVVSAIAHFLQSKNPAGNHQTRVLLIAILLISCAFGWYMALSLWHFLLLTLVASMGLAWLTPLYSTLLSLQNANHHHVAAQLSLTHLLGHCVGLMVSAQLLAGTLQHFFIWLMILGFLIMVAIVSWVVPTQRR